MILNRNPLVFSIGYNDLEDRFDVNYYKPEYIDIINRVKKSHGTKPLGDIIHLSSEKWTKPKSGKFNYIEIKNIDRFSAQITAAKEIDVKEAPSRAKKVLRKDDIIVSTTRPYRGAIASVPDEYNGYICSTGFAVLRKNKIQINRKYLLYFLHSRFGLKQMEQRMTGGNYPAILPSQLLKILIPVPPLEIQENIAIMVDEAIEGKKIIEKELNDVSNSIDDYILEELGILLSNSNEKSPSIFVRGFNSLENERWDVPFWKPFYTEFEDAIKKGKYGFKTLNHFIKEINYGASVKNIYSDEGIPLLRILNLMPNEINLKDVVKVSYELKNKIGKSYVKEGDLLISRSGTIGIVAIVPPEADGFAFGSYMIRFRIDTTDETKFYISAILNSIVGKIQTNRNKIGAIQTNITIPSIKQIMIPIPEEESERSRIANEVKNRLNKAKNLRVKSRNVFDKVNVEIEKIVLGD